MTEIPLTITDAAAALRSGALTSVALTTACFEAADELDEQIGCYLERLDEPALEAAAAADRALAAGEVSGPLLGIPVGIKDIIATNDGPTTGQSLILDRTWGDQGDAPVVARLRSAGAVIAGKVTTMEFACGMADPEKPFPIPRNPWNLDRWPGGSSSGTGNGIAAGLFLGGLGTDTGGSIRCPAAYCGISGIKATFGRVPKSGCVPLGYSLDNIGPMARSAHDCALMLEVLAGYDSSDPYAADVPVPQYTDALDGDLSAMRLGVDRVHTIDRAEDQAVVAAFDAVLEELAACGATIEEVELPLYDELVAATMATAYAEAFAYHRNDLASRWSDYGKATRLFLARGALMSSADFVQAQRVRTAGLAAMKAAFQPFDAVLTPTALLGAPPALGTDLDDILGAICTPVWNAVGFPALSVPMGFDSEQLPVSLQIIAAPFAETATFKVGDAFQRRTDWHLQVPSVAAAVAA
jgi:aspartyl-tRNA(Asn)/glutamyl-tRNA(Gln) amidotransferase subunit A